MQFTLEEAIKYSKQGKIEEWVQLFLRDDKTDHANPNRALADGLFLEERFYYGPINFKLNGNDVVVINIGEDKYKEEGFKAYLFKKDVSKNVRITDNIDYEKVGTYEIKYRIVGLISLQSLQPLLAK